MIDGIAPDVRITTESDLTAGAVFGGGLLAGLADGTLLVWNGRDRAPSLTLKPHLARMIAVGPGKDEAEAWSLFADGTLARTRLAAGAKAALRKLDLGVAATRVALFSPDGTRLLAGGELGEIRVFDTATGAILQQLRGHRTELQDMALAPSPTVLASASAEADLRIWDLTSGRELVSVDSDLSIFALAFNPRDGMLAVGGVDRTVTFRPPSGYRSAGTIALAVPKMVAALAWSPDGRRLAVGDIDDRTLSKGGLQVFDSVSRQAIATLDTADVPNVKVAFVADGTRVVGAVARLLRAWPIPAEA